MFDIAISSTLNRYCIDEKILYRTRIGKIRKEETGRDQQRLDRTRIGKRR